MATRSMINKLPKGYLPVGLSLAMQESQGGKTRFYKILASFRFSDVIEEYTLAGDSEEEVHNQILDWLDTSGYALRYSIH